MDITASRKPLADLAADWLIVGLWENEPLSAAAQELDRKLGGLLTRCKERGDWSGKAKELTPLLNPTGIAAGRLMLVGLGVRGKADMGGLIACAAAATRAVTSKAYERLAIAVPENVPGLSGEGAAVAM